VTKDITALVLEKPTYEKLCRPALRTDSMQESSLANEAIQYFVDAVANRRRPSSCKDVRYPKGLMVQSIQRSAFGRAAALTRFSRVQGLNTDGFRDALWVGTGMPHAQADPEVIVRSLRPLLDSLGHLATSAEIIASGALPT